MSSPFFETEFSVSGSENMAEMDEFDPADIPEGFQAWSDNDKDAYLIRLRWCMAARPNQLPPSGDWWIWLLLAGRGFGKTRTAAEDIAYHAQVNPGWRLAAIAPTAADVRDTLIEGESGILAVLSRQGLKTDGTPKLVEKWNRSMGELILANGSIIKGIPGDEPDRLRGPQFHRTWVDELAAMERQDECWMNVEMATRLGTDPRIIVTTTPRPTQLIRELVLRSLPKAERAALRKAQQEMETGVASPGSKSIANPLYACFVAMQ